MLTGMDLVVLLDLSRRRDAWTDSQVARSCGLADAALLASLDRAERAHLYSSGRRRVNYLSLKEFVLVAVRYVFATEEEPAGARRRRGVPTAWSSPPLSRQIRSAGAVVWPDPRGDVLGTRVIQPLAPQAVEVARRDPEMHELLALVDAIRAGRARERALAGQDLAQRLAP